MIKQLFEQISVFGITKDTPPRLQKKIIIFNQLMVVSILVSFLFLPVYFFLEEYFFLVLSSVSIVIASVSLYVNAKNQYSVASVGLTVFYYLLVFLCASVAGEAANFQYLFIPLTFYSLIFFRGETWKIFSGFFLSGLGFFLLEFTDYSLLVEYRPHGGFLKSLHPFLLFLSILFSFLAFLFLIRSNSVIESELLENRKAFDEIIDSVFEIFFQCEIKNNRIYRINFISPKIFSVMEIEKEEIAKNPNAIYEIVTPKYKKKVLQSFIKLVRNPARLRLEFEIRTKSKAFRWIEVEAIQEKKSPNTFCLNGYFKDLTDQKIDQVANLVIKNELENFKKAVDEHCLVSITDREGKILYVNSKLLEVSEHSEDELIGYTHRVLNSGYHPEKFWKNLWDTVLDQKIWRGEIRNKSKTGKLYWVNATIFPLLDSKNKPYQFVAIRTDITDYKKIQEELNEKNEKLRSALAKAESANIAKNKFISTVSHELRTPLNAIIGFSELLKNPALDVNDRVKYIKLTNQSAKHLVGLVNEILDISHSESDEIKIHKIEMNLKSFLFDSMEKFMIQAKKKNLLFQTSIDDTIPNYVIGDPKRLNQILDNLLGNAVKFTDSGKIELIVQDKTNGNRDKEAVLRFMVKDTGSGISVEGTSKVFEPFYRETLSHIEGTGLGLSVSQEIAKAFGSKIQVETELGKGSVFWFDLTFPVVQQELSFGDLTENTNFLKKFSGKKVLIADDVELNRILLSEVLLGWGFQVVEASDGLEVLDRLNQFLPDIILLDIVMPNLDGISTLQRIKLEKRFSEIPVICVTASGFDGKREELISKGFDEYILKPVEFGDLYQKIHTLLSKNK